jgi:excisionase family DNA binding protein
MRAYRPRTAHVPPPGTSPLEGLLTPEEAAIAMGVTHAAVVRAIREGRLRAWARAGVYLIPAAELETWQPVKGRGRRKTRLPAPQEVPAD